MPVSIVHNKATPAWDMVASPHTAQDYPDVSNVPLTTGRSQLSLLTPNPAVNVVCVHCSRQQPDTRFHMFHIPAHKVSPVVSGERAMQRLNGELQCLHNASQAHPEQASDVARRIRLNDVQWAYQHNAMKVTARRNCGLVAA